MKQEKFWVEKKGGLVRWIPSSGFYVGRLDEARSIAAAEAENAGVEYPCMVIMEDRKAVDIYHVNNDLSSSGV